MKKTTKSGRDLLSQNLKVLRSVHSFSQDTLAKQLEINRSALGAYEEGRAEPGQFLLVKISELFGISTDRLLKEDIQQTIHRLLQANAATDGLGVHPTYTAQDIKGSNMRILTVTLGKDNRENIMLVNRKAAAGYLQGLNDTENKALGDLPTFNLPSLPNDKTYRAFEIEGDSMLPVSSGTIVVGEYVEDWNDIKNDQTYIVVTQAGDGIVYKRIHNRIVEDRQLLLKSDNPLYYPYPVSIDDVKEVWKAVRLISDNVPTTSEVTPDKLMSSINEMRNEILRLTQLLNGKHNNEPN